MNAQAVLEKKLQANALNDLVTEWGTIGICATPAFMMDDQRGIQAFLLLGFTSLGTWALVRTVRRIQTGKRTVIPQATAIDSEQVVSVHEDHGRVSSSVQVHLLDGQTLSIQAHRDDCSALIEFMKAQAPHAVFGPRAGEQLGNAEQPAT